MKISSLFFRLFLRFNLFLLMSACMHGGRQQEANDAVLNAFLDRAFDESAERSPEFLTQLGLKRHYGKLDQRTEAAAKKTLEMQKKQLKELIAIGDDGLSPEARLSYKLFKKALEDSIEQYQWRHYGYSVTQMYGVHSNLPAFMMTMHRVDNEEDLRAYISRLEAFKRVFMETIDGLKKSEAAGVVPPQFVYPYVLAASQNVILGRPFTQGSQDSPLLSDFKNKLGKLNLPQAKKTYFIMKAEKALKESVGPAYNDLMMFLKVQKQRATADAGAWKFPKGDKYYRQQLINYTTTTKTADEIHELGIKEVARIQKEMKSLLPQLGFRGSLQDFFKEIRTNEKYYYPNTEQGRKAYLEDSFKYYTAMNEKVPEFFRLLPKAPFEIRAVEKFREDSAGVAFYEHPSEDGSRPGVYYVNLKEMKNLPKHEAEVILYHEGAPGHHFQIALAQELKGLPKFRRFGGYTAYSEGWGLYTETLAQEMGAYKEPLSKFGKLAAEILRAARLVVDTGLHHKKWTREQAIEYMSKNCPGPLEDQKNEVERYIVMPGQATAYTVGMIKILELRQMAQQKLGKKFDIRDFHDEVLGHGPVPLDALEGIIVESVDLKK